MYVCMYVCMYVFSFRIPSPLLAVIRVELVDTCEHKWNTWHETTHFNQLLGIRILLR